MRKRFYKEGIDHFEPHEVIEMILYFAYLRIDTNPLAHKLIDRFGSFHGVLEANREDLLESGLTENAAALLNMIPAFSNYYMQSHIETKVLPDSTAVGNYAVSKLGLRPTEVFAVICLNAQNRVLNFEILSEGTVNTSNVPPRKVAEAALRNHAASVVLTHNHPGGGLMPSTEDKELTKKLDSMLESIGVTLIDHIIVANGRFCSLREHGIF